MDIEGPVADDAVPFEDGLRPVVGDWYMPAPHARLLTGWKRRVALLLVATFLLIESYGLCTTFGVGR